MSTVTEAHDQKAWNSFLAAQTFRPFLQSWEMGEVYRDIGQEPVRLEVREGNELMAVKQAKRLVEHLNSMKYTSHFQ